MTAHTDLCRDASERIPEILEGTAPPSVFEHIASCDHCRDLRFEADRAIETVSAAGADFRAPDGFAERLVAGVLAARPEGPDRSGVVPTGASRASTASVADDIARAGATPSRDPIAEAMGSAPTELGASDPALAEGTPHRTVGSSDTVFEGLPASLREERAAASAARADEPFVPVLKTVPLHAITPAPASAAPGSEVSRGTADSSLSVAQAVTGKVGTDPGSSDAGSLGAARVDSSVESAARTDAPRADRPRSGGRQAPAGGSAAAARGGQVVPLHRRPGAVAGMGAGLIAAAAASWMLFAGRGDDARTTSVEGPWSGKIAKLARASTDGASGLEVCAASANGACTAATADTTFEAGATLRTDAKTRARIELADGTVVAMDRGSELQLPAGASRTARLARGVVTADVAKVDGAQPATFELPQGRIEVIGTKIVMTASERRSSVEVARGEVRVTGASGQPVDVRAGEEAILSTSGEVTVSNATSLADSLEWSSDTPEEADAPALRGLGELRAKKPGETKEREGAVRLAKHSVKTRIVDTVARTEIEEVFTNQTDDELEGIFRFPLPPGAQIERLALEVDGKLIDGAFVDRDRGAAIWRGVIQNAAPKAPRPREEIIWVPGPWRDPALLEWQRGGRFELRIFPIPKRGSRRVVLAYTQVVPQSAGVRRFSYPLAHDPSGSTRVDDFSMDVQVLGHDREFGVQTRGYELRGVGGGDGTRLTLAETGFVPAGDLTVEYALPNRQNEITTWAYRMEGPIAGIDPATGKPSASPPVTSTLAKTADEKRAEEEARAVADDRSPFVAIALRPKLPRWGEGKERVHAIVVDSSRSMVGERFGRASRLASSIVREMDRRDTFVLLACDVTCQVLGAEPGRPMGAGPTEPSAAAADDVERFLGTIEPDGGSDLAASVEAARTASGPLNGRELRVIYLGDGTPSVGPTRPAHLEAAVRHALPASDGSVVAVALGADADTTSLAALARGGGGVVVPYVPGQRVASAALDVLTAAYGVVLRDPVVELPAGLVQVTPARMDPVLGGDETYVFARMTGDRVEGQVRLRGRVGDEPFEQTYPATVVASTSAGNAFVPRLFAAAKIDELERLGGAEVKPTIVALSRKFAVASRHTSLLVLESEAMFTAFGLDRSSVAPSFTGEVLADSHSADVDGEQAEEQAAGDSLDALSEAKGAARKPSRSLDLGFDDEGTIGGGGLGLGGGGRSASGGPGAAPTTAAPPAQAAPAPPPRPSEEWDPFGGQRDEPKKEKADQAARRPADEPWNDRRRRPSNMVPMRRIFERKASFTAGNVLASEKAGELLTAEAAAKASPDSRDKTATLFALYSATGRVGEAQELAARWASRDALDPEALLARADLAARNGDRDRSARILSGLADVRPGDRAVQERLAAFHEAAGDHRLACRHHLALAALVPGEAKAVASASRCAREQGLSELSGLLRSDAPERLRAEVDRLSVAPAPPAAPLVGDVRLAATWTGGEDLDISLVDASGKRHAWSGSPSKTVRVSVQDAASVRAETLAFANLPSGQYVVEIARTRDGGTTPVSGEVAFTLPGGEVRKVPFTLGASRAEVGTLRVFFTSRLVPLDGFGGGGGGWRGGSW